MKHKDVLKFKVGDVFYYEDDTASSVCFFGVIVDLRDGWVYEYKKLYGRQTNADDFYVGSCFYDTARLIDGDEGRLLKVLF